MITDSRIGETHRMQGRDPRPPRTSPRWTAGIPLNCHLDHQRLKFALPGRAGLGPDGRDRADELPRPSFLTHSGSLRPMAIERTFSIIKPDAVAKNHIGDIYQRFEQGGLRIVAARMLHLSREQASAFYAVHQARPFFGELVDFMTSGPIMVQVLEGENAIARNRELMGATDPAKAAPGTIRADFAQEVTENAVHGSDGPDTAAIEIAFFFPEGVCERTR